MTNWQQILEPHDSWNERHILAAFSLFGIPSTYLDVGCGTGVMVRTARSLGCEAYGVDQIEHEEPFFFKKDLAETVFFLEFATSGVANMADLVTCLEVAEHLNDDGSIRLCDTIARHVAEGGKLIFSSAHPGQGGDGHIGIKPATFWREQLHRHGVHYRQDLSTQLALIWSNIGSPLYWLAANVQVFDR